MIAFSAIVVINSDESPHRQVWRASETLPPGLTVLVFTKHHLPLNTDDFRWFRNDLNYHVICEPKVVQPWMGYLQFVGGDLDGKQ